MAGRRSADTAVDREGALVLGAFRLISERGFEGLRLRDVAATAGIDHSTLHHYFPTKQDLVAAVVAHAIDEFRAQADTGDEPGARRRLRLHLQRLAAALRTRPELYLVLREMDLRAARDPAVRDILDGHERGWRAALSARFRDAEAEAGAQRVDAPRIDPERGTELVIAAVKGASFAPAAGADSLELLAELLYPDAT
ncbi:TetR/AcrR family transcriptional regulator [Pseudonocardia acaciae]|uniref:TetR/AcrR family transcriptional regulator n=1 Tax=Pseudonocardia acaciae TaxID=551276 RepID=UPI00048D8114|nr:TetR/AcrR family transcriptional regulator [Pseudonocardia acaciae]